MANVNLDALIPREDFEIIGRGAEAPRKQELQILDLERNAFFYGALRKPDFQRETADWNAKRVVGLIRSFLEDELIPAVILWQNRELTFVIDGSHRLGALIAWVQDDYGDRALSQEFFNHDIPEEQLRVAKRTRSLVENAFGSYQSHKEAIADQDAYGPDILARARRLGNLSLSLQWVRGDAAKAEASFHRINRQAAIIKPQELELLKSRKKPAVIAARAIIRRGTGHKYWSSFGDTEQETIQSLATEVYGLLFEPTLRYPIKSLDLPAGGAVYSATALRMVYDFIIQSAGTPSPEDDESGHRTIEYLKRCGRVMRLIVSNHESSVGLHPAVYFYSWTGKQQPILFLTWVGILLEYARAKKLADFTESRQALEAFLLDHRSLINQVVRKYGTTKSGKRHLRRFYDLVLESVEAGLEGSDVVDVLRGEFRYLQPDETAYGGAKPKFSTQVKSGVAMKSLLDASAALKCAICGGFVPGQALSIDHIERASEGGTSTADNAQVTHPYCNTGYKESLQADG